MKNQQKAVKNWENATQKLADEFVKKYYSDPEDEEYRPDAYWIGDEVGNCFFVNDDFYSFDRIVEALKFGATYEQLRNYAEYEMRCLELRESKVNFRNYIKFPEFKKLVEI